MIAVIYNQERKSSEIFSIYRTVVLICRKKEQFCVEGKLYNN